MILDDLVAGAILMTGNTDYLNTQEQFEGYAIMPPTKSPVTLYKGAIILKLKITALKYWFARNISQGRSLFDDFLQPKGLSLKRMSTYKKTMMPALPSLNPHSSVPMTSSWREKKQPMSPKIQQALPTLAEDAVEEQNDDEQNSSRELNPPERGEDNQD